MARGEASSALTEWAGTVPTSEHEAVPVANPLPEPDVAPSDLDDVRVVAVLAVLRGATIESTATRWAMDPVLLQRWVGGFVTAGTAAVLNRVDHAAGRHRERLLAAVATEIHQPLATARQWAEPLVLSDHADAATRLVSALDELEDRVTGAELVVASALGHVSVTKGDVALGALFARVPDLGPVRGKGPDHVVSVDLDRFARVLSDVWAVAHRWPAPRSVQLYVRHVGPWAEFRVLRQGDPIDTDVLQALFEPFDRDHRHAGVTVGLYLARTLTVAHGGTLGVDQDDQGAAFWIRVPAVQQPAHLHESHPAVPSDQSDPQPDPR